MIGTRTPLHPLTGADQTETKAGIRSQVALSASFAEQIDRHIISVASGHRWTYDHFGENNFTFGAAQLIAHLMIRTAAMASETLCIPAQPKELHSREETLSSVATTSSRTVRSSKVCSPTMWDSEKSATPSS